MKRNDEYIKFTSNQMYTNLKTMKFGDLRRSSITVIIWLINKRLYTKCVNRISSIEYNEVWARAYIRGVIAYYLQENEKSFKSAIKEKIDDIKSLLTEPEFKDTVDKLSVESFLKMDKDSEFKEFDRIYGKYHDKKKITDERLREDEENKKRIQKRNEELQKDEELEDEKIGNLF